VDQGDHESDSHFHGPGIVTANMDGSMQRFIHRSGDLLSPQQLTLDRVNRRVYFTDPQQNCIFALNYDGGTRSMSIYIHLYSPVHGRKNAKQYNKLN